MKHITALLGLAALTGIHAEESHLRQAKVRTLEDSDYGFLISSIDQDQDWCITATDGAGVNANIGFEPCNFVAEPSDQLWRFDGDGKIHSKLNDNRCMTVNFGEQVFDGVRVRMAACDQNTDLNEFSHNGDIDKLRLVERPDYCITNRGVAAHSSDTIHAKPCKDEGRYIFKYLRGDINPSPDDYAFLVSHIREDDPWCITTSNGVEPFANLGFLRCNFNGAPDSQKWRLDTSGKLHSKVNPSLCMIVNYGNSVFDGARVRIAECNEDTELNRFTHNGSTDKIRLASQPDYCITNRGTRPNTGDTIHAKPCKEEGRYIYTYHGSSTTTESPPPLITTTPPPPITINSQLLVGFEGRPSAVTEDEIAVLEQAFRTSYESQECSIDSVMIDTGNIQDYGLGEAGSANSRPFTYTADASGQCQKPGCEYSSFFQNPFTAFIIDPFECPVVKKEDFLFSYNETIQNLKTSGQLKNVASVTNNLAELTEQPDCTNLGENFTDYLRVVFEGDSPPSDSELDVLETAFVDSYNEANTLNGDTCDPLYRVLISVEFTFVQLTDSRRRLGSEYNAETYGTCNEEASNCNLYDDLSRRQLVSANAAEQAFSHSSVFPGRRLQLPAEDCLCPIGSGLIGFAARNIPPVESRGPTAEEHRLYYNELIQFLRSEGIITSVTSVSSIRDPGEGPV